MVTGVFLVAQFGHQKCHQNGAFQELRPDSTVLVLLCTFQDQVSVKFR